jgi:hypothetical protein
VAKFENIGDYIVFSEEEILDPESLIRALENSPYCSDLGRGRVKFFSHHGFDLVVRQYVHGGILRGITGERYISGKRAIREFLLLSNLKKRGFPCPEPYCVVIRRGVLFKKLYIITKEIKNCKPLAITLRQKDGLNRTRYIYGLAKLLIKLFSYNVFHPDFHLLNVIGRSPKELFLCDFDRAKIKKAIAEKDLLKMILRLYRHGRALKKKGEIKLEKNEELFFLRVCCHLLGRDIISVVMGKIRKTEFFQNIGWFLESKLYGRKK